jgi:4a-hydroxytetrahydrobiopterin dehydratase
MMEYWTKKNDALCAEFTFKDFVEAWAFMCEVAMTAEKMNHHPNWSNVYNKVVIQLSTHEAGNTVTKKDDDLANAINLILAKYKF